MYTLLRKKKRFISNTGDLTSVMSGIHELKSSVTLTI